MDPCEKLIIKHDNVMLTSMTNSLLGDHQVAVVDVDGRPEDGKSQIF